MSVAIQTPQLQTPDSATGDASGTDSSAANATLAALADAVSQANDPSAALGELKRAGHHGKLAKLEQTTGLSADAIIDKLSGMTGIAPSAASAAGAPFASDGLQSARTGGVLTGQVGNVQGYDQDYGALKQAFDANGVKAPTEKELTAVASASSGSAGVDNLVSQVKSSITSGTALPTMGEYQETQKELESARMQQLLQRKKTDADGDDQVTGEIKSPAALVMFVMLKAKSELLKEKSDDLASLQKYSSISDALSNYMSDTILPTQQRLSSAVNAEKDDSKKANVSVPADIANNFNIDNLDSSGKLMAMPTYQTDSHGNTTQVPTNRQVSQTDMTAITDNFKNIQQQVQQRISKEQTAYSGHDSQDSTLSNIISAVNKTFNDSVSAIGRNITT